MADRYWVGGTATWDATVGLKWSLTSGGAGGETVPSASDAVFFNAASGANTVTISGTRTCASIDCTGFTGTLTGTATPILQVSGNFTLSAGMTFNTALATIQILATSNITLAGKTVNSMTINGAGITATFLDTFRCAAVLTLTQGTLTVGANDVYVGDSVTASGASTRVLNMGSGVWYSNGTGNAIAWSFSGSNVTVNKQTCQRIELLEFQTGTAPTWSIVGNGLSFPALHCKASLPGWTVSLSTGGLTTDALNFSAATSYGVIRLTGGITVTFTNFVKPTAKTGTKLETSAGTTTASLSCAAGTVDLSNLYVRGMLAGGGASYVCTNGFDGGANTGIAFYNARGLGLHSLEAGM